jgi:hypothetical protein
MPLREKGEKLSDFIGRFVSNKHEKHKFRDIKQRLAVAYSEARQSKKGRLHAKA